MGCDSHPVIEKQQKSGKWIAVNSKRRYHNMIYGRKLREGIGNDQKVLEQRRKVIEEAFATKHGQAVQVLSNRDYTMFAVLADVRNDGIAPLFAGRGMPEDASNFTKKDMPEDSDYHSHTFFTVQELLDTDWDAQACSRGRAILFADQYVEWKETGIVPAAAQEYSYGDDAKTREVSEEEMTMLLMSNDVKKLVRMPGKKYRRSEELIRYGPYVTVEAPRSYRAIVPGLVGIIPDLQKLGKPDKVRVCIAFDN